jgi:hypothetical protein
VCARGSGECERGGQSVVERVAVVRNKIRLRGWKRLKDKNSKEGKGKTGKVKVRERMEKAKSSGCSTTKGKVRGGSRYVLWSSLMRPGLYQNRATLGRRRVEGKESDGETPAQNSPREFPSSSSQEESGWDRAEPVGWTRETWATSLTTTHCVVLEYCTPSPRGNNNGSLFLSKKVTGKLKKEGLAVLVWHRGGSPGLCALALVCAMLLCLLTADPQLPTNASVGRVKVGKQGGNHRGDKLMNNKAKLYKPWENKEMGYHFNV